MTHERDSRTFRALFKPALFKPFPGTDTPGGFSDAWESKPDGVLANLSLAAYHPGPQVKEKMEQLGADFAEAYDHEGAQAFLAVWPEKAVLAFRGTEPDEEHRLSLGFLTPIRQFVERQLGIDLPDELCGLLSPDLLADFNFRTAASGGAEVHRGFLVELDKLWGRILPDLESRVSAGEIPVYATGHSLGGAMATLAGTRYPFTGVVTFGEPRVGRGVEAAFQAGFHRRYVNGEDPVTKLPPSGFGYEHHGEVVHVSDPGGPDVRFDHSMVDYVVKLS